jgi:hypothetical protein
MPPKAGFVFLQRVDCSVWDWLADFASLVFLAECAGQLRCSGLSSRSKPPLVLVRPCSLVHNPGRSPTHHIRSGDFNSHESRCSFPGFWFWSLRFVIQSAGFGFCLKFLPPFIGFDSFNLLRFIVGRSWYHSQVTRSKDSSFFNTCCTFMIIFQSDTQCV